MQIKRFDSHRVHSFGDMKSLVMSPSDFDLPQFVLSKAQSSEPLEVLVISNEHANCDSLPLRYGMHFKTDSSIVLTRLDLPNSHQTKSDRIRVDAYFTDSNGNEKFGHFVIGSRRGLNKPVLITVWRNDAKTEEHLSEVMSGLRKRGYLSSSVLLDLHPDYVGGKIATHEDLVILLARTMSAEKVNMMDEIVASSVVRVNKANTERDEAVAKAVEADKRNQETSIKLAKAQEENEELIVKNHQLEAEKLRYKQEAESARRDNKQATLSSPDTLVKVLERQIYRGSSCTILIMGDGSRRHMKTATFDPTGSVTAHAKNLQGRRVRISCWDPINQPGRWSNEGYFRNIYAVE